MMSTVQDFYAAINGSSKLDFSTEEFGLIREEYSYTPIHAIGKYTQLEFKTWKIQHHKIDKINDVGQNFFLREKNKYIVLNMNPKNSLAWTSKTQNIELEPKFGIFFNIPKNEFKIENLSLLDFIIIEFKEAYFNQSIFNDSLRSYLKTILNSNDRFTFDITPNLSSLLVEIFKKKSLGLCQLMDLNNKVFELLSTVIDFSSMPQKETTIHPYHKQLEKVKNQIHENLETQFSIEALSKTAGLNTSYLKKYFKESYGITIFEYSQKKRIQYAKKLLKKTTFTIALISEKVGYQQSAHFSHAFKRNTGLSPNQYRKKNNSTIIPQ